VDGLVVPGLLLLVARDLLLHDPPRVLAWRLLHDDRLLAVPGWLAPLLPAPPPGFDRDPIALALAAVAVAVAVAYLAAALWRASVAVRGALIAAAAVVVVVVPTLALIAMGAVTQRPYGQDGGVVQIPLALDRILAGQTPYGADYSDSILGKQARVSEFWQAWGGNPILRHHAYLPATDLLMLPFHAASRAALGWFDPRTVTLLAWAAAAWLAARVVGRGARGLTAAAVVAVSPLVYWHQIFGANDLLPAALILLAVLLGQRGWLTAAGAALGLACATKQLAWPFAPFLLAALAGARDGRGLAAESRPRLLRAGAAALATFAAFVLPVAALDLRAFWSDVVLYNAGLGADNYPFGGTPGFGLANLVIYAGGVASLRDTLPLGVMYLPLLPLVAWLLRTQLRQGGLGLALLCGAATLAATLYVSRVPHANYLVLVAVLAPVGLLMDGRRAADVVVAPLLLLALSVEVAERELLRATWEQAMAFGLPRRAHGLTAAALPRAGPGLTADPLGLLLSAVLAGLAIAYLWAGLLGAGARARRTVAALAAIVAVVVPTLAVVELGRASGAVRAQDAWTAAASPRAPVLEAWSASFRRDPPAAIVPQGPGAVGAAVVRAALWALGRADPRLLSLLAVGLCAALLSALAPLDRHPLALAAALLSPAAVVAVVFGSPAVVGLAGALAAGWLAPTRPLAGGAVLGVSAVLVPPTLFALPVVLSPLSGAQARRAVPGMLIGLAGQLPLLAFGPGVGLPNLFLYRDGATPAGAAVLVALRLAALAGIGVIARRADGDRWALAAGSATLGLWLTPGASGHDLALPLGLLAVAATASPTTHQWVPEGRPGPVTPPA
jgi:hypothetical protein